MTDDPVTRRDFDALEKRVDRLDERLSTTETQTAATVATQRAMGDQMRRDVDTLRADMGTLRSEQAAMRAEVLEGLRGIGERLEGFATARVQDIKDTSKWLGKIPWVLLAIAVSAIGWLLKK